MPEGEIIPRVTTFEPTGTPHELANPKFLEGLSMKIEPRRKLVPLFEYLKGAQNKPRGQEGGQTDLNSHFEQFIVREGGEIKLKDLSEFSEMLRLAGFNADLLGVQSVGNKNQQVTAVVQDVDPNNPQSGYERPVTAEGPHMIIAPYATDENGQLHVFRTVQFRTGSAGIDTARGFLDAQTLSSGQHIYKVEGSEGKVQENLRRIIKEEGGEKLLNIKKVQFLGAHTVNKSFVTSPSALFAVEVDYETFTQLKNVVSAEEAARRKFEFEQQGLTDMILDMTPEQYVHYKTNPSLAKDMASDSATDIVMMDFLMRELQKTKMKERTAEIKQEAKPESDSSGAHLLTKARKLLHTLRHKKSA